MLRNSRRSVHIHHQQSNDHCDVTYAIGEETPPFAQFGHQDSRHCGPDYACPIEHGRVECNRIHQVFLAHHVNQKSLACRNIERVHHPEERGQYEYQPDATFNLVGKSESCQDKRQQHRCDLRGDDHPLPVKTIGNDPSNGRKQENRNLAGKTHSPKLQTRPGQPVDEPRLRHRLHPRADQGDKLSTEEKLEVTVSKRPSRRLPPRCAA